MSLLPATTTDLPELTQLINSAYRGDSSRKGWTTEADLLGGIRTSEASLAETIAKPDSTILIHRDEATDVLIGCVYLEKKADLMYLGMLTVSPEIQARGIGKKLLQEAENYAHTLGCIAVEMTVISQRAELIAWYERRGFALTGETRPFPMNDPRFGEPKTNLEFVVMRKGL
ncbi:GNAT family N-acetyltransferase [Persicitalea jodogahamensis]|uniref:N-acetyltransferase n=1 Tax=Persicitalea jodogahamensis TaxID=402147 RepID=A0A8J3D4B2_9BACT|nr:GNAT family N-acetyltransferase [Persicitalea jodogahamensis]GHB71045.1 N-acetyltransferase [Persicitalea jodogahamensis]